MQAVIPRLAITTGEPAGIGPDLCLALDGCRVEAELVLIGDPALLEARARELGRRIHLPAYQPETAPQAGSRSVVMRSVCKNRKRWRACSGNALFVVRLPLCGVLGVYMLPI